MSDPSGEELDSSSSATPCLDEEGLRVQGYDVVIIGTRLVHAIVASAFSRAGKSVLHCDSNDFYGETDAVLSLDALIQLSSNDIPLGTCSLFRIHSASHSSSPRHALLTVGTDVITPFGQGIVERLPAIKINDSDASTSLQVRLKQWTLTTVGKSPIAYFGPPPVSKMGNNNALQISYLSKYYADEFDIIPIASLQYQQLIHSSIARAFAIDLTPSLLFAQGLAVQGLVQSSASDYCEFKSMISLYFLSEGKLSPVPSSKGDIFSTKLLSPMEKRKLMKFLQLALDYAVSIQDQKNCHAEEHLTSSTSDPLSSTTETQSQIPFSDTSSTPYNYIDEDKVTSLNERELHMGRSLYRPQNKPVSTNDLEELYACFQTEMPFDAFLEIKHGLSKQLRDIVIYAMALSSSPREEYSTQRGMLDLSKHLLSLGRFGSTGFLTPMHGAGEIPQAFCRSAAVHGVTYLLRRKPKRLVFSDDEKSILGIELYPNIDVDNNKTKNDINIQDTTYVRAKNIVIPYNLIQSKDVESGLKIQLKTKRMIRRISIFRNKLISNCDDSRHAEQRHVIIIPPQTFGNEYPIRGMVLDESAHIAPWSIGGEFSVSVLHLSTVVLDDNDAIESGHNALERAVQVLSETQSIGRDVLSKLEELYHIAFNYAYVVDGKDESTLDIQGLFPTYWQGESMTMDSAFYEAEEIFQKLCPNHSFLSLSDELAALIQERQLQTKTDDHEDDLLL